jgi:hypothetical protein
VSVTTSALSLSAGLRQLRFAVVTSIKLVPEVESRSGTQRMALEAAAKQLLVQTKNFVEFMVFAVVTVHDT